MDKYSRITLVSNKKEYLEKTVSLIGTVLRDIVLAFVISLLICYLIGFKAFIVNGGSSEPYIHYRSICFDYKCPYEELRQGDFITFSISGKTYTTHRIVAIAEKGQTFKKNSIIYFTHEGVNYKLIVEKTCEIITMATNPKSLKEDKLKFQKGGGVEPIQPGILLEYSNYENFQGKVIDSSLELGNLILFLRDNIIQIVAYCLIFYLAHEVIKYVPDYIRLF